MSHASNPESDAPTPDGAAADQANDDHGDAHGDDGHGDGNGEDSLGPINVAAWGAGLFGAIVGLVIAACFVVATSPG
jgi:hypothetical protein